MAAVNCTPETHALVREARMATGKSHFRIIAEAMELWMAVNLPVSPSAEDLSPAPMAPGGCEAQPEHSV